MHKVNTSTSNCSSHLSNVHGIIEDQGKNINDTELIIIPHDEPRQIQLCQYLADWIITDSQPLNVLENSAFKKFINELDPKFKIPCIKSIKKLIPLRGGMASFFAPSSDLDIHEPNTSISEAEISTSASSNPTNIKVQVIVQFQLI
ncbi:3576_t:CDS:2 [Gigaspora margarita]|uniref:3576_t:CDS:1 n=1 Tax=Gigaspora margarita TaxID=4874 RepID=A0ABN7USI7_GIGMA|nr:3576_t:CDS:2 [Gigaspora margarita]